MIVLDHKSHHHCRHCCQLLPVRIPSVFIVQEVFTRSWITSRGLHNLHNKRIRWLKPVKTLNQAVSCLKCFSVFTTLFGGHRTSRRGCDLSWVCTVCFSTKNCHPVKKRPRSKVQISPYISRHQPVYICVFGPEVKQPFNLFNGALILFWPSSGFPCFAGSSS